MLTLTRSHNQEIILVVPPSSEPTQIKIAYLGQHRRNRNYARIGVKAPKQVPISRGEGNVAFKK